MLKKIISFVKKHKDEISEIGSVSADIIQTAAEFKQYPNIFSKIRIAASSVQQVSRVITVLNRFNNKGKILIDSRYISFFDFFEDKKIKFDNGLEELIIEKETYSIVSYLDNGRRLIYLKGKKEDFDKDIVEKLKEKLGKYIVLDFSKRTSDSNGLSIYKNASCVIQTSDISKKIIQDILKWQNANEGYTILLHGPPGTGKSTVARSVAEQFDGCITLRGISNDYYSFETILFFLQILKSSLFIIEDIDRVSFTEDLMNAIDQFRSMGMFVIATANKYKKMDTALVRPGRFDKTIYVSSLGKNVIKNLVKNDPQIFKIAKNFSVAETVELMRRVRVLGREEAINTAQDLMDRSEAIRQEYQLEELQVQEENQPRRRKSKNLKLETKLETVAESNVIFDNVPETNKKIETIS